MPAYSPTMRRRRLAAELRRLRELAGMTQEDVAGRLEVGPVQAEPDREPPGRDHCPGPAQAP